MPPEKRVALELGNIAQAVQEYSVPKASASNTHSRSVYGEAVARAAPRVHPDDISGMSTLVCSSVLDRRTTTSFGDRKVGVRNRHVACWAQGVVSRLRGYVPNARCERRIRTRVPASQQSCRHASEPRAETVLCSRALDEDFSALLRCESNRALCGGAGFTT
jgi:hypothetical protein